jgi:hypothetical protein
MINFHASTFAWKGHPTKPDPHYKYPGGLVSKSGVVIHVRMSLEAVCTITDESTGHVSEMFMNAPCRAEYTIAKRNLFQVPGNQFRYAFNRERTVTIANRPSDEVEEIKNSSLSESFDSHKLDVRHYDNASTTADPAEIIEATLANDLMTARSTYRDTDRGLSIAIEYPVNLINVNPVDAEYQVCTGPVIVPDLETWDGKNVSRVFLAHVAFTASDYVEFILRREVDPSDSEKQWLTKPRGLDRNALHDPANQPSDYPIRKWQATAYSEVWEKEGADNIIMRVPNP